MLYANAQAVWREPYGVRREAIHLKLSLYSMLPKVKQA
jgi:hypothetical protein